MTDDQAAAAEAKTARKKPPVPPEEKDAEIRFGKALVRALWQAEYQAANPDATPAQRAEAWKAARADRMQAQLKGMRNALRQLGKHGYSFTAPPLPEGAKADED